ncbi:MAG TPA: sigma-54-dependent Fis family transcriptional regulator [Gammaproteobacteria bacterium]|nr:sigma-54-dependent Fis family transcriptional regulator [Gammaproteobacteria bacterium]
MTADLRKLDHGMLAEMLECIEYPAIALSTDYLILAANRRYREIYGASFREGRSRCFEVSHRYTVPCDQAGESCPLKNCLESGGLQRVLHLHHTPGGLEHVDVETRPVRDEEGKIRYCIEILRHSEVASSRPLKEGLVGRAPAFNRMLDLIQRVAPRNTSVLLLGESGTGKELAARAIHEASSRAKGALVPVECSGLSESLFESELFGHEKGAFTGAHSRKIGLVEAARGGTLFLDEVGDIPLNLQVKLLRLLETGSFRRVGATEPIRADFRLVCATHRDLKSMVAAGEFREDLYYRINAFPIHVPALRERMEDLPLLVESLLSRVVTDRAVRMSPDTLRLLGRYDFPGNIRELRNVLEWACVMADDGVIRHEHLPDYLREALQQSAEGPLEDLDQEDAPVLGLAEMERRYLQKLIARHGSKRTVARLLGISERTLYRKLRAG